MDSSGWKTSFGKERHSVTGVVLSPRTWLLTLCVSCKENLKALRLRSSESYDFHAPNQRRWMDCCVDSESTEWTSGKLHPRLWWLPSRTESPSPDLLNHVIFTGCSPKGGEHVWGIWKQLDSLLRLATLCRFASKCYREFSSQGTPHYVKPPLPLERRTSEWCLKALKAAARAPLSLSSVLPVQNSGLWFQTWLSDACREHL
jgi:hypothetical protein